MLGAPSSRNQWSQVVQNPEQNKADSEMTCNHAFALLPDEEVGQVGRRPRVERR
jgi:hypothetical protein